MCLTVQLIEARLIDSEGCGIVRGQYDMRCAGLNRRTPGYPGIENINIVLIQTRAANTVQEFEESRIALPVDMLQRDQSECARAECVRTEEVRISIALLQDFFLLKIKTGLHVEML